MATKVMKIGLSNADKSTMSSQVALETINKLIDAYSTSKQYAVGDYVNNSGIVYVCIEATSGAWDSTKWSVATLNQVIDKINSAADSVNNKAEKDGYYETFGYAREAGIAKNLQNDEGKLLDPDVDTSSGTTYADAPFVQRATAMTMKAYLDNELITVGSGFEQWRKEQAFSIVRNQLINVPTISTNTYNGLTITNNADGTLTLNGTTNAAVDNQISNVFNKCLANHKYLIIQNNSNNDCTIGFYAGSANYFTNNGFIICSYTTDTNVNFQFSIGANKTFTNLKIRPVVIDLTQWFASRPEIATALSGDAGVKWFLQNYPEALTLGYDAGTIVDTEDYDYETTGVNLWDEEWELGDLNTTTGEKSISNNSICSKNNIRVFPNTVYNIKKPISETAFVLFYDINGNVLQYVKGNNDTANVYNYAANIEGTQGNTLFTTPANCSYILFNIRGIATYNNDIQICHHFTETSVENTYHKYEIFKDRVSWTFTSTGKGKSAGSVADTKDYVNKKNIEKVGQVDLEDIVFTWDGTRWYANASSLVIKLPSSNYNKANLTSSKYSVYAINTMATDSSKIGIGVATNGNFYVYNNDSTNQPSGILNYELATPIETDMEGDEYDTNIPENDYGVERKVPVSGEMFSGSATTIFYQDNVLRQIYNNKSSIDNLQFDVDTLEGRIPVAPTTDGTYTLKAVVSNGIATYSWTLDSQGE